MDNKNTGNANPYDVICAYACPTTDFRPHPYDFQTDWKENIEVPIEEIKKVREIYGIKVGTDYIVSGDIVVFYKLDTPEKRQKMIETYEKLKEL